MGLKYNVNKIHSDLISRFNGQDIKIEEKSNSKFGSYVEVTVNNENKELKMIIEKVSLQNDEFSWCYYSNPNDENSHLVERNSNLENFSLHVKDIFDKNRFDKEYLENLTK